MHRPRALVPAWIVALAAALAPVAAHADVVMGPPTDCPPGATGDTSHNGPWCRPTTCTSDADCVGQAPDLVCREQPLCIETRSEPSRSGWSHGKPFERVLAHSVCAAGSPCTAPASCETAKRCVAPATPPAETATPTPTPAPAPAPAEAPPAADGARCQVTSPTNPAGAIWLLGSLGLARRRRAAGRR